MLKRTPLFEAHQELGARIVEFAGWQMPVQYTGIVEEHMAVRSAAGVFDISHMGEFLVSGRRAVEFLNHALTNDIRKLSPGEGQYTLMCNEKGGTVDDLYAYRLRDEEFLLIVNASRIAADFKWLNSILSSTGYTDGVTLRDVSPETAAIAVQGPAVAKFIDAVFKGVQGGPSMLRKNEVQPFLSDAGAEVWVSRTGYTGEDGFEVVCPNGVAVPVWRSLLEAGRPHGIKPAGLGARDTLRTEVCYPLYGHELDEETGPVEAGLGFFVAFDKGEFVGKEALMARKATGAQKKLVAFKTTEKCAPPRPGYSVWRELERGERVGQVASGTLSPSLGTGIGMAYLQPDAAVIGSTVYMDIRGRRTPILLVKRPLYRRT